MNGNNKQPKKNINSKGSALISAIIVLLIVTVLTAIAMNTTTQDLKLTGKYSGETQARYIAEAGVQHALKVLSGMTVKKALDGNDGKPDAPHAQDNGYLAGIHTYNQSGVGFGGGSYNVQVLDNVNPGTNWLDTDDRIIIRSVGRIGNITKTIEVLIDKSLPPNIKGAITANFNIKPTGAFYLSGKDHDKDKNVIPSRGTYAVVTAAPTEAVPTPQEWNKAFAPGGGATTDGTYLNKDHTYQDASDTDPDRDKIISLKAGYSATDPDQVFGFPSGSGTLESIAKGTHPFIKITGSNFFTSEPPNGTILKGVTYVNSDWNNGKIEGEGILIVHRAGSPPAELKNMQGGTFKGIIIADSLNGYKADILGAVVTLATPLIMPPGSEGHIGSAHGEILFSREMIFNQLGALEIRPKILTWHDR